MGKAQSTAKFTEKAMMIHGNRYSYQYVTYLGSHVNVEIVCSKHGIFQQTPTNHLSGKGCNRCSYELRGIQKMFGTDEFVSSSKATHGDRYDYSQSVYDGRHRNIKIVCRDHGEFLQIAGVHIEGGGCPECARHHAQRNIKDRFDQLGYNTDGFRQKAQQYHGTKYDYSRLEYTGKDNKVLIGCPVHGDFWQRAAAHLKGHGCRKCSRNAIANDLKRSQADFIASSDRVHNGKFDYSQVNYINGKTKVKIICPNHGIFEQSPASHSKGIGCSRCSRSYGEESVASALDQMGVSYETQKKFVTCRAKRKLAFDFFVESHNMLIEYHGKQHYDPIEHFDGIIGFEKTIKHDSIKAEWVKNNGYNLLIIPYTEHNSIENILKAALLN